MRRAIAISSLLLAVSVVPPAWAAPGAEAHTDLNCVILPDEQVEVSSPVPGVIAAVSVKRSDRVQHGQIVARLESSVEEATVALAAVRAATDAEIRLRRVEHGYDAQHHGRLRVLHTRHAASAQSLDDAERVAEAARLRVRLAEDRRREAVFERRRADAVLGLKTIRSPIDGVIVQRHKTVGEYVEDQPIVRIARLDPLRVEVIVPLALFGTVHAGMQVAVRPEVDPDRERIATVTAVDAVADPGSGTFGVELELPNPKLALPAGIKCKGRLLARVAGDPAESLPAHPGPREHASSRNADTTGREPATPGRVDDEWNVQPSPAASRVADGPAERGPTHPQTRGHAASTNTDTARRETVTTERIDDEPDPQPVPAAIVSARGGTAGFCITYRAIVDERKVRALSDAVAAMGGQAAITEVGEPGASGYLVVTPAASGTEHRSALLARLRDAGFNDLAVLARGPHAGRIALGVYRGPRSAERRRAALAERGFDVEVVVRSNAQRRWRAELRLPPGLQHGAATAALRQAAGGAAGESGACSPLRTAAR